MKQQQTTYPAFWRLCAAAILGAGPVLASAALPPFQDKAAVRQWSAQTDRMIVKYKEARVAAGQRCRPRARSGRPSCSAPASSSACAPPCCTPPAPAPT
ncbi:hypothetical protein LP419_34835 [Massilia sp. H-1]|nr:hypothetical protein LP419_34835 [Massilia sp. H-1]